MKSQLKALSIMFYYLVLKQVLHWLCGFSHRVVMQEGLYLGARELVSWGLNGLKLNGLQSDQPRHLRCNVLLAVLNLAHQIR